MSIKVLIFAALLAAFGIFLIATAPVSSHHTSGKLPLVPYTWLIQTMLADGEVRWCVDNRARDWPGFVSQLYQVNDAAAEYPGIPHRQIDVDIPGSKSLEDAKASALDAGCMILHRIPDNHGCSGCAGWIMYGDRPAVVEYKMQVIASYTDLKTTQAHEGTNCGHAMGEHEGYDDLKSVSHIVTYGYWASPWNGPTVMDVGSHFVVAGGVWRCTENDVRLLCSWLDPGGERFAGCGFQEPKPPPEWCCDTVYPGWEGTVARLHQPSATWYWGIGDYRSVEQLWRWRDAGPWECTANCPGIKE